MPARTTLYIGTRKGAFIFRGNPGRTAWKVDGPHYLGTIVYHLVPDPRNRKTILMAAKDGHLGHVIYRSFDGGKKWAQSKQPPAFAKVEGAGGRAVQHVFWLTPGHASQPGVWFAGTAPHGIWKSTDNGDTWEGVKGFNDHPDWIKIRGTIDPPDAPSTHSIRIDPRDANHMYACFSAGGIFESRDGFATWKALNKGLDNDYAPKDGSEHYGHDPHNLHLHPQNPDRIYQQNHFGIYRIDRPSDTWVRIGRNMPKPIGDIGFPIVLHPRDVDTAWVFPMDGTSVWPRVSPGGKPAVYKTANGGKSWVRQDKGLPRSQGWFTVKRQCMASDEGKPLGLYFGTWSGQIWASRDEGKSWKKIVEHLPPICSVIATSE